MWLESKQGMLKLRLSKKELSAVFCVVSALTYHAWYTWRNAIHVQARLTQCELDMAEIRRQIAQGGARFEHKVAATQGGN